MTLEEVEKSWAEYCTSSSGGDGEAGNEGRCAHLGRTATGGKDGADTDILDVLGVNAGALDDGLHGTCHEVGGLGVLESTLATFCQSRPQSGGHDDLPLRQPLAINVI